MSTDKATSKRLIPLIKSNQPEVKGSASIDLEWIPYKGKYEHSKTKIFAACFCTNQGKKIVLHISNFPTERELVESILYYFNQFPLTFGWYSTGVVVYDDNDPNSRLRGRDSDLFILHQRCQLYGLKSLFEVKKTYVKLIDSDRNRKHIDLHSVFDKQMIQDGVFERKYRTPSLQNVSQALLGIGKYGKLNAGTSDVQSLPLKEQIQYVKRDSELCMLLAQYNNCLALQIMKVIAKYSEMDYYQVCHTNVSNWYANLYRKMLESGRCTVAYTPSYKLPKQQIAGGHHTKPVKGFFVNTKVYELDVKGQYPSIVINNNFSFDTLNCTCCQYREDAQVKREIINTINEQLERNGISRRVEKYWVRRRFKGAFPQVVDKILGDRDRYLGLLKQEKSKPNPNSKMVEEYQTHQLGAKLFVNAGAGLFGTKYFDFSNYIVNECITAEGRRIHKQMEAMGQKEPYNFKIVFGFTDSTFFANVRSEEKAREFIQDCKYKLGVTVELKNVFLNSIFYDLKNRFVAWTGNDNEAPIIKGLNGLSEFDPLWVKRWVEKIFVQLIKQPETRFQIIPSMLKEAFSDLDNGRVNVEELRFTHRLAKYRYEYKKEHVRACKLGKLFGKDKGDLVYWYETYTEEYVKSKKCYKGKKSYSIKPENLNLYEYKNFLLKKLKDTLEIAGFNFLELKEKLIVNEDEQGQANQANQVNQNSNLTTSLEGALMKL